MGQATRPGDRLPGPAQNRRVQSIGRSIAEFSAGFANPLQARVFLDMFHCLRLFPEAAYEAGAIDRELMASGGRLGEADTLIAGTARYYGIPLVSNDRAFDRVRGLRRIAY